VPATPAAEAAQTPALERPGVERFETAREELGGLAEGGEKKM
jgi:hypothetical protein